MSLTFNRVPTYKGLFSFFRVPGIAVANNPILSVFNMTGSRVLVAVKEISFVHERTSNSTNQRFYGLSRISTAPTDGGKPGWEPFDTTKSHDNAVELRHAGTSDGVVGTFTATPGVAGWRATGSLMHFATGGLAEQVQAIPQRMLPFPNRNDPLILRNNEGILVVEIDAGSTSGHVVISIAWEEFVYERTPRSTPYPQLLAH